MGRKSLRSYKKRSKRSKRSCKKSSKRSCKKSGKRSKRSCKKSSKRSYKFNLVIDGGMDNGDNTINFDVIYDFKLIELEGCGACKDAKKLIKDKGYTLDVKKELTNEENEIIKKTTGKTYDYFPKIFKYNNVTKKYNFIGGYDKLQTII